MLIAPTPLRGEVWLVNFDPSVGAEITKKRPAVVVNADDVGRLPLRLVVPLTDWKRPYSGLSWFTLLRPTPANGLMKDSRADAFQIKSLSLARFMRRLGAITPKEIEAIADSIAVCVGTS